MNPITRAVAKSQGLTQYFTGKPCLHGHLAPRQVSNYGCLECKKITDAKDYQRHKSQRDKRNLEWKKNNPEARKQHISDYYQRNRERLLSERDKEADLERLHRWKKENPELVNANTAKRRAAKLQAIPPWADLEKIKDFYKNCPEEHHVDHIVPLRHSLVCGLHVSENLQYLTAEENLKKGNSFTR